MNSESGLARGGTLVPSVRTATNPDDIGFVKVGQTGLRQVAKTAGAGGFVPSGRSYHTVVWTGSEMIVWGGSDGNNLNDGGRYDPITHSWAAIPINGAPSACVGHTAVWTGTEMIVWGGSDGNILNTGARYNPIANSWVAIQANGAPSARSGHSAVWTGDEMIVWGGYHGSNLNDGGRYNPGANSWSATPAVGAPRATSYHTAVWTGTEMIVWGGYAGGGPPYSNEGGRYNPAANSWSAMSTTAAPVARQYHTAVWTGTEMIMWGGLNNGNYLNDGGRYNPVVNSWISTPVVDAPSVRYSHSAVWTGTEMIVWGGFSYGEYFKDVGRYNPAANKWTLAQSTSAPSGRASHTAVWTGSEMIVWGGSNQYGKAYLNDGGRYNPASNTWDATGTSVAPRLTIQIAGSSAILSWTGLSTGYRLQQSGSFNAGDWTSAGNPVNINGTNQVTIQPSTGSSFFRLISP